MSNVYVTLIGGVGNQLFQIAAAYAYAKKHNKRLILDDSKWHSSQGNHPSVHKNGLYQNFFFSSYHPKTPTNLFESRFNYDELPYEKGDVVLNGYFQSLKYFEEYQDEIKEMFNFDKYKNTKILGSDLSVAAHIRRGDYLMHHHIHYVCDTNYFTKAFCLFPDKTIDVFSDSINHVINEFPKENLRFIDGSDEVASLYILSQYDNLIASNSSFSWWSSFLGKKKSKIIVPDRWFKNFENHDDIYRDDFTKIPV